VAARRVDDQVDSREHAAVVRATGWSPGDPDGQAVCRESVGDCPPEWAIAQDRCLHRGVLRVEWV